MSLDLEAIKAWTQEEQPGGINPQIVKEMVEEIEALRKRVETLTLLIKINNSKRSE